MATVKTHRYFLGIGSNINRVAHIKSCLYYLRCSFKGLQASDTYQSQAFGFQGQDFYNLVVTFDSAFKPHALKRWLQQLEDQYGRDRSQPKYSDRKLDIDLLLCDDLIIDDGLVQIPRHEIIKRKYVLKPLQDLAPNLRHPVTKKRLADLWQALDAADTTTVQKVTFQ